MMGAMVSPLKGADGNVEFLAWLHARPTAATDPTGAAVPSTAAPLAERIGIDGLVDAAAAGRDR